MEAAHRDRPPRAGRGQSFNGPGAGSAERPESWSSSPKHTEAQGLISQLPTGSYWGLFNFFFDTSSLQGLRAEDVPRPGNKPPGRELQVFTQRLQFLQSVVKGVNGADSLL